MKTEYKVIVLSVAIGLVVWVIDALIDFLFFYKKSFQSVLIPDSLDFELYLRLVWILFFLIFGIVVSKVIAKHRISEEELLKFRLGIDRSADATFITDIDGNIVYVNPAFEQIYGFSKEEAFGKTPRILKSGVHPAEVYKHFWETLLAKKVVNGELVNKTKDGKLLNIEGSANPILDKDRNIIGFLAIQRDITKRKQAEDAIRESEEHYRKLVELSPDAIAIHSEGRIVFSNSAGAKLMGVADPEQLIGKSIMDFVHADYREIVNERVQKMMKEGKDVPLTEEKFIRFDGSIIDVEVSAIPFTYKGKRAMQVIVHDVTERKKTEEKIREQAALLDHAQEAIAVRDLEHNFIYWNRGSTRLYGWKEEEVTGKNAINLIYKTESSELIEANKSVMENGEWMGEMHQVTKEGKEVIVDSSWTLMHDSKGKPKSILIINTDITDKKRLETQLLRAQRMESIGTLAGGIAHDLNNVLTPIMLSLQLLKDKFTDEESQKLLDILERNSKRGADLIRQVLSFARGIEGERKTIQITNLITEIEKITKETFPKSIEVRTSVSGDIWTIIGDATQLHQVMMNLCVNARDAMPDGGILSIYAENFFIDENYARVNLEAKVGASIVITVSDTGIGIPHEDIDRIFEPFFTTKEFGKGTGLGLSTALAIVKSHGGFINVYSEVGKGSVFRIYLPAISAVEVPKVQEQQLKLYAGHGELILIVDDEAPIREVTSATLKANNYGALIANDGAEAVVLYTQNRDDVKLVLMDMAMPVMDGLASIRVLNKINPQLKIIAVSGLTEKDRTSKVTDYVHAFLPKPYNAEELLKTIYEVMNSKKETEQKQQPT